MVDPWAIRRRLRSDSWRIVCLDQIGSTNDVALRAGRLGLGERLAILTEWQTRGRGRQNRRWETPPGLALLCSTLWRPPVDAERALGMAQVCAVAARRALAAAGIDARLKWPNDIMIGRAKVGGVLIESALDGSRLDHVVAGIGLNVNQTMVDLPSTTYPTTSLALAAGHLFDRNTLAAGLLDALASAYEQWLADPVDVFTQWRGGLDHFGQTVVVTSAEGEVRGRTVDVEPDGRLIVRTVAGRIVRLFAGDVSLVETQTGVFDSDAG